MGAGCNSHIPRKISLQTAEGLGLEKDLFVHYTDIKKKVLYYDCGVAVWSLYIVLSVLNFASLLSTLLVHDKLDYSIDRNGSLQISPGSSFRNFLLFCAWPPDFMSIFLLKGNEMENSYQPSHFVLLHHFTSNDIPAGTEIPLNSRKPGTRDLIQQNIRSYRELLLWEISFLGKTLLQHSCLSFFFLLQKFLILAFFFLFLHSQ